MCIIKSSYHCTVSLGYGVERMVLSAEVWESDRQLAKNASVTVSICTGRKAVLPSKTQQSSALTSGIGMTPERDYSLNLS